MTDPITSLRHAVARATDEAMCASDPDLIRAQVLALGAEVLVALPFVTGDAATLANHARVADAMTERAIAAESDRDEARDAIHLLAVRVTQATQAGDDPAAVEATPEGAVEAVRALRADCDEAEAARGRAWEARDAASIEAARLLGLPRIGQPTRAEWDAHRTTGGEWICVHRITGDWDCGVAMLHSERADLWHIPVRDGAPCLWPVAAAEGGA